MRFGVGCELQFRVESDCTFLFHVGVEENDFQQRVEEHIRLTPDLEHQDRALPGSRRRYLHLNARPGPLTLRYEAAVDLNPAWCAEDDAAEMPTSRLPLETFPYLLPSRYCPSDILLSFAEKEFGGLSPGYSRVTAICNWIYDYLDYEPGASNSSTTAADTLTRRAGVCRDYAHLGVSLCRALNIPARYLSVYAWGLSQPDFHACFECYLGGRWVLFDATRLAPLTGFVRIGEGRDAADISFCSIYGAAELVMMNTFANALPGSGGEPAQPQWSNAPLISSR